MSEPRPVYVMDEPLDGEGRVCPICGEVEHDEVEVYQAGAMVTYPSMRLSFKGCCSQECARTLYLCQVFSHSKTPPG